MSMRIVCPEGHIVVIDAAQIGAAVTCPECSASVPYDIDAVRHARKEEGKRRRSAEDDDDEGDDDDRPQKKASGKKPSDADAIQDKGAKKAPRQSDADNEKPAKKASTRAADDEDDDRSSRKKPRRSDDDVDDVEIEDDDESDDGIEWTARKEQLLMCSHGLVAMIVGCCIFIAFNLFNWLWMALFEMELRLVFSGIILFFGILLILNYFGVLVGDLARAERFVQIMAVASGACLVIGMIAAMAFLAKVMVFMKLTMESSQAVTHMMFVILLWAVMIGLVYISPMVKNWFGDWLGYIVAGVAAIVNGLAEYMLISLIFLILKVRTTIAKFIKEE
ncbi:MAG: hypothetical protein HYR84_12110 [Planctomycetes bacterium]|nr:hypothetical protein [Planctomycetota bacterium]